MFSTHLRKINYMEQSFEVIMPLFNYNLFMALIAKLIDAPIYAANTSLVTLNVFNVFEILIA